MRRILRKIAEGDISDLGDTSTLADPTVVDALVEGRTVEELLEDSKRSRGTHWHQHSRL